MNKTKKIKLYRFAKRFLVSKEFADDLELARKNYMKAIINALKKKKEG
jgi:hypothetical protein